MKSRPGEDLVIGIDCSTTAVKAIAWDFRGRAVANGRAPLGIQTPYPGFYEQSAEDWWAATCLALNQVLSIVDPKQIRALAVAHQRETFVPLGANVEPLRPAILWMDQRAHSLLPDLAISLDAEKYHLRTGKPLSANLAPPKIEWLHRNEPDTHQKTAFWLDTHAYLVYKFTGELATSIGSADPLGLFNLSAGQWDVPVLDVLQMDPFSLPAVFTPGTFLGYVTSKAAAETGLNAGTPVAAGLGDGQAAVLGLGINTPGSVSLSLGTSVIGGCFSPEYRTSLAFRTMSGAAGAYIFETVILSGTQILNWLVKDLLGLADTRQSLVELEAAAVDISPGSAGLILVPYWNGALNPYWDPSASGILVGLRGHHRAAHIFRAALEGIAFELRLHLEGVEAALSTPIQKLIVSGGGSRSLLWLQIIANVTGKAVYPTLESEASSLGAAMLAAFASGWFSSIAETSNAMAAPIAGKSIPISELYAKYSTLYSHGYRPLYPAIRSSLGILNHQE